MFSHAYAVRAAEVGPDGRCSLPTLLDLFQDIANRHAVALGWDMQTLLDRGEAWLMAQIAIERLEAPLPRAGEAVRIETWPSDASRLYVHRDARLRTDAGDAAHVTSRWLVLDLAARRPARLPDDLNAIVDAARPPLLELPRLRWSGDAEHAADVRVARRDLDLNGHANNVAFARWALEAVPAAVYDARALRRIDYAVRKEALWGERLVSHAAPTEDGFAHRVTRGQDELALARTRWR